MKLLALICLSMILNGQPRQVLLFYSKDAKSTYDKQLAELEKGKDGMKERDIEIKAFSSSKDFSEFKKWKVDESMAFTFILIGKDGGEKYRSNEIVSYKELFGKIDAMPMRKSELKNQ